MGALIHLTAPASAIPDGARVYYSVGRSLTASDFELQSKYIDARLLGLTPANTGVISGLGVSLARYDNLAAQASPPNFTVALVRASARTAASCASRRRSHSPGLIC